MNLNIFKIPSVKNTHNTLIELGFTVSYWVDYSIYYTHDNANIPYIKFGAVSESITTYHEI